MLFWCLQPGSERIRLCSVGYRSSASDLQPAILEPRVRGTESAASGQTFPARSRWISSPSLLLLVSCGRRGSEALFHTFNKNKTAFKLSSTPERRCIGTGLPRAVETSGGPNMTVQGGEEKKKRKKKKRVMLRMVREGKKEGGVKGSCYGVAAYRVRPAAMFSL